MRHVRRAAGTVVSIVALVAVVWWAKDQERPEFPARATDWFQLVAAVAVYVLITAVRGWRWHAILRYAHIGHRPADAAALVVVGYMGNTVLPARGGELLRTLLLAARSDAKRREVLGSIVSERLLDAATLVVLFVGLTFAGVAPPALGTGLAIACVVGAAALVVAAWSVFRIRRSGRLGRVAAVIRPFIRATRPLMGRRGVALLAVTTVLWLLEVVVFWLVAQSVNVEVTFVEGAFVVALTSFVMSIPAAPGYVGTFDAALLFGLSGYGVQGGQALAFALLWRFVLFVPITVVGLILMFARYGGFPTHGSGVEARATPSTIRRR